MRVVKRLRPRIITAFAWFSACFVGASIVWAHSVGQVQTTKSLAPETVNLLLSRASGGSPGFAVGDIVSYIIQFTPVNNGADVGVAGYITDYIPPGTEVVDASIVFKDAAGNFVNIPPSFPGGIDDGWGRGQNNFLTPFNTAAYDTTGRCTAAGVTNNCNARLSQLHADTGIFYSTDPRTAVFPALPVRINQGNGYDISPTAEGALNSVIGQTRATTHNLWDADQTNAFGSTAGAVALLVAPKSAAPSLTGGNGPSPYNAGSAVAGPQTGYLLDNTAAVGPWKRIAYPGSRIGDSSTGPATSATGGAPVAISGQPTSVGYNLSPSNPLPAGTNAVRWAVGQLTVGEIRYVKISLRLTAPVPSAGIVNSSEVFGGDAGGADDGKDSVWRYHVPSVADNNSNLLVQKTAKCIVVAGVCTPTTGAYIPADAVVRY
jgi:large repetitive protein